MAAKIRKSFGLRKGAQLPDVYDRELLGNGPVNGIPVANLEVEINYGKALGAGQIVEQAEYFRRYVMDAGECVAAASGRIQTGVGAAYFACGDIGPAHKPQAVVEQQVALRLPFAHKKRGQRPRAPLLPEPPEIQVREYINIVHQERLKGGRSSVRIVENCCRSSGGVSLLPAL